RRLKTEYEKEYKEVINEKAVRRIMLKYGIHCKIRQKRFIRKDHEPEKIVPNILNRNFKADRSGIKMGIDITYYPTGDSSKPWIYVCAIKDLHHDEIVSYSADTHQKTDLVMQALEKLEKKGFEKG